MHLHLLCDEIYCAITEMKIIEKEADAHDEIRVRNLKASYAHVK